jgi:peptidyl-dipeptidase Dcp
MKASSRVTNEKSRKTLVAADSAADNPMLSPWVGPHGGVPPLDRVRVSDFLPALDRAIHAKLAEIERIADDPSAPDFENTLEALERSGELLRRVETFATIWRSTMSTPELQALEAR